MKTLHIKDSPRRTLIYRPLARPRPSGVSGVLIGYIKAGKKFLYALALALMATQPAAAQPHIVGISPVFCDPFFGCYVYVFAEQLANKSVTIEAATAPNFQESYVAAFYDCYPERQNVVATVPAGAGWTFFRARNDPCNGLVPGRTQVVDSGKVVRNPLTGGLVSLWEIMPPVPQEDAWPRYVAKPILEP